MKHYIDDYAPYNGPWMAPSGRRYNIVAVDPTQIQLAPGRALAVAKTEEEAALFFGFTRFKIETWLLKPRLRPRANYVIPKVAKRLTTLVSRDGLLNTPITVILDGKSYVVKVSTAD